MNATTSLYSWIRGLITAIKQRLCSHTFALEDLELVDEDSADARVRWPCAKCGRVFWAGYGLAISPKHGFMFRRSVTPSSDTLTP